MSVSSSVDTDLDLNLKPRVSGPKLKCVIRLRAAQRETAALLYEV